MTPNDNDRDHWLVRPRTITGLWIAFIVILALTVLGDFVFPPKGKFGVDGTIGFYAWFGLVSCVALIIGPRLLGMILKRPDDYYGS